MLKFEIDGSQVEKLTAELGLTHKQAKFALSRALRRTATTLRVKSERGLKSRLNVKKMAYLRRRLRMSQFKRGSFAGASIWYGTNNMPVSALRGRIRKGRKKDGGASFTGKAGSQTFKGGFIRPSRRGWGRTIFMRKGKARLPIGEADMPVQDDMNIFVEDEVFDQVNEIFWKYFERDMLARSQYGVGHTEYQNQRGQRQ